VSIAVSQLLLIHKDIIKLMLLIKQSNSRSWIKPAVIECYSIFIMKQLIFKLCIFLLHIAMFYRHRYYF